MRAAPALALVGLLVVAPAARSATAETRGGEGYVIEVVAPPFAQLMPQLQGLLAEIDVFLAQNP